MGEPTSIEEAKVRSSIEIHACNTTLDLKLEDERMKELTISCSLDAFVERCWLLAGPFAEFHDKTTAALNAPPGLFSNILDPVMVEATKIYKLQVESAVKHLKEETESVAKQKKTQADALTAAALLPADQVLARAFAATLNKGGKTIDPNNPRIDYLKMINVAMNVPTLVTSSTSSQLPNNEVSPGAARGSSSHVAKSPASAAPRSKHHGQGAKGSGSPQKGGKSSGKGKGKGKGQSSPQSPPDGKKGKPKGSGRGGKSAGKGKPKAIHH